MSETDSLLLADLTWTGRDFAPGLAVGIDPQGRITRVAPLEPHERPRAIVLRGRALLPGMVYAHSHAFQRALRFRPERFDTGSGNFWTWRDTMYRLVDELDAQAFYDTCRRCFGEMLQAGVTTVGEFHYLHHEVEQDWAFDDAILAAARDAGIRIRLIQCYYASGGINRPLAGAQRRFDGLSIDAFLRQFETLNAKLDPATQSLGIACHSIRGASIDDIEHFWNMARRMDVPFHIHVEEQRQEIIDCVDAYGVAPLRLMLGRLSIDPHFTAIHCTHSQPEDLKELAARGGHICLCPSTEANLADGLPRLRDMRAADAKIAIGSDCNLRLSMSEDLRWLEYGHRLASESSGIVLDADGLVAPGLFELATVNGAGALRLPVGAIATRAQADLVTLDLNHPSLAGAADDALLHAFIFGCGNGAVDQVWVGGRRVSGATGSPSAR